MIDISEEYMNRVFPVLGGISAVLLLGSFFLEGVTQNVLRIRGFMLLISYCVYKIMRSGRDGKAD